MKKKNAIKTQQFSIAISLLTIFILLLSQNTTPAAAQSSSPPSGQVAYADSNQNIWIIRSGDEQPTQITQDGGNQNKIWYRGPSFSPDGSKLAFCKNVTVDNNSTQTISIIDLNDMSLLLSIEDSNCPVEWSADSNSIIYGRTFEYYPQAGSEDFWQNERGIWLTDLSSGQSSELIPLFSQNPLMAPDWSPDEKWVQFHEIEYIEGSGMFTTWNADSKQIYQELSNAGSSSWSPDSSQIVYDEVTYIGVAGSGIYIANPDQSNPRQIYQDPNLAASNPLWSPKGDLIAFMANEEDNYESGTLVLMTPDGTTHSTTTIPAQILTAWSPDGTILMFPQQKEGFQHDLVFFDINQQSTIITIPNAGYDADWGNLPSAASTYSISGQISDADNQPLSGIQINAEPGGYTTASDDQGFYTFTDLPAGSYSLTAAMIGLSFEPPLIQAELNNNLENQNFKATPLTAPTESAQQTMGEDQQQPIQPTQVTQSSQEDSSEQNGNQPLKLLIGVLAVGGLLVIALIVILVLFFVFKNKKA